MDSSSRIVDEPVHPLRGSQFHHGLPGFSGCPAVNQHGLVQAVDGLAKMLSSLSPRQPTVGSIPTCKQADLVWRGRIWHDRAVFHGLTNPAARQAYVQCWAAIERAPNLSVNGIR